MIHEVISTHLSCCSYPIYIGDGILKKADLLTSHIGGQQVLIVTQANIAHFYLSFLQQQLHQYTIDVFLLPEGEQYKNIDEWQKIIDKLLANSHERSTTLIALGGGMVGDMTGFAAACYQRGVNYIQIPTSLMAQVDSAIGGKTAINVAQGKNMLGAFYHPKAVIIDVQVLMTLPAREYISGIAEIVKYGLIKDAEFFLWLEKNFVALLNRDVSALLHVVSKCVEIKTDIVMQDEKDQHLRKILNLGHTFGHALEAGLAYQNILHGEAVAWGIVIAAELSMMKAFISVEEVERVKRLLKMAGLLQYSSDFPSVSELITLMQSDKKVSNKQINFILLKKIGEAICVNDVTAEEIKQVLQRVVPY